ncbi:hypothetical protein FACHB389_34765 [Nostoc calcicola FACHB-389]|nr:hypothetical protein [Nostoc calcicola FACHB-3891]OKH17309.1 hypothetical protein FACHB389_34765 [Nostoc calcicola FACHB-389]
MPENTYKINLPWTEEHEAFCYQHHIPPAAKSLWQWLMRQGEIAAEIEPDLSEFNAWVEKLRGKKYTHNYLKQMFELLQNHRVVQVVKQYSWKIFKLLVRPLEWLKPPKKKREKNLHNNNSSYTLQASNQQSTDAGIIQQQHSNSESNRELLNENGIHYDAEEKEVLERPTDEIKVALALFDIRGAFEKILNPEGWIRRCLRGRWWEHPRNYGLLTKYFGNLNEWDWQELFSTS